MIWLVAKSVYFRISSLTPCMVLGGIFQVVSQRDVALYGILCALASLPRGEIKAKILHNANFQKMLASTPDLKRLARHATPRHATLPPPSTSLWPCSWRACADVAKSRGRGRAAAPLAVAIRRETR